MMPSPDVLPAGHPALTVSVISTVRNEEQSIGALLQSLRCQTRPPDEIVIADGGSRDRTVSIIEGFRSDGLNVRLIMAPGSNISQGRNRAIAAATGSVIASVDAGVRLAPAWLEELIRPFTVGASPPDVVGGFFEPDPQTTFETAMGATVLPRLQDVNPATFLPSSRSVAFTRDAWLKAGGYPEWIDYCEDLIFDFALRSAGCRFFFAPRAVVAFRPRSNLKAFFVQYYRYARGDGKADLWRKRHALRYATYIAAPLVMAAGLRYHVLWIVLAVAALAYCWTPWQRLRPLLGGLGVGDRIYAVALVPVIRLVGDLAKMAGYPAGVWWRLRHRPR